MRLSYIVLVAAAATLLASGNAATASVPATGDSTMASSDLVASLGTTAQDVGGEKRFLRKHKDEVDEEDDDEERKKPPRLL
ncbi:hypothetical protein PRIC1_007083 [Phytophthora ramorum]|uniref:uncharacterized protein n=1 Tax=Phytophthora ramorum TaxID=164328 RepID=UPI00309E611B|nr:hypothetical protein KRP23_2704 [Phytophthora ramorum]KAH7501956.1 hypothetical protein KRP22_7430 [Phytophthora ramorum]